MRRLFLSLISSLGLSILAAAATVADTIPAPWIAAGR